MTAPPEGMVALVTGAGRGIGKAVAVHLAGGGADAAVLAWSASDLAATASQVREPGHFGGLTWTSTSSLSRCRAPCCRR